MLLKICIINVLDVNKDIIWIQLLIDVKILIMVVIILMVDVPHVKHHLYIIQKHNHVSLMDVNNISLEDVKFVIININ